MKMKSSWRYVVVFLIGFVLGSLPVYLHYRNRNSEAMETALDSWAFENSTAKIIDAVNTLAQLRKGKADYVIDLLERDLTGDIYLLQLGFPELITADADSCRILKAASQYRANYPFKTGNPERDKVVEELLRREEFKQE